MDRKKGSRGKMKMHKLIYNYRFIVAQELTVLITKIEKVDNISTNFIYKLSWAAPRGKESIK